MSLPIDPRPIHPFYNVPINEDGSLDLSNGVPIPQEQRESLHASLADALAAIEKADSDQKKEKILSEIEGALRVVAFLLPLAISQQMLPARLAANAPSLVKGAEAFVKAIEESPKP